MRDIHEDARVALGQEPAQRLVESRGIALAAAETAFDLDDHRRTRRGFTVATVSMLSGPMKKTSLPSRDHLGEVPPRAEICHLPPGPGNGTTGN